MMAGETVLSWDIHSLTVTNTTRSLFSRDVVNRHTLLRNVRGYAKSGSLLAIMGPSGAGKTTLLATLSQRISGELVGEVMVNGQVADQELMVRISAFVPQQDLAVTCLTALEHLIFMASLKMDRRVSRVQMERIVYCLINDLNLSNCSYTRISALSGGERKRLSLATQMLTDPPILFCDEPTTGLDSYNAMSVVNVLRTLTARGKTVVCSIHQPSSEVYMMFDQVCLLVPGGGLAYHGKVTEAQTYFQNLGMQCPELYNPADFFLSKLNTTSDSTNQICEQFSISYMNRSLLADLASIKKESVMNQFVFGIEDKFLKFYSVQTSSPQKQLKWLMWRSVVEMFRERQRILLRFFMYIVVGTLLSMPYITIQLDQAGIQSLQGFHYSVITETIFAQTYAILHTFPAELTVMLREIDNGVYEPGPYYFSKAFTLLPKVVLETMAFCMIAFSIVGVEGGPLGFFLFCCPVIASAIVSTAYGCCISAMFENVSTASLFSVPMDFISYTFSGLFLHLRTVPVYLRWVKYISRFYYGMEAMSILQWRLIDVIPCPEKTDIPCISSGDEVLNKYGYSRNNLLLDFVGLFLTFIILHIIGFAALKRRSKRHSVY